MSKQTVWLLGGSGVMLMGAVVGAFILGKQSTRSSYPPLPPSPATRTVPSEPLPASTQTSLRVITNTPIVTMGDTITVRVVVNPADPPLTAATLQILFDPATLSAGSMRAGSLWTDANILEEYAQNGMVRFSLGRGFGAQTTSDDDTIAVFTFTPIHIGETSINIGPDTLLVRSADQGALPTKNESLRLTIR